MDHVLVMSLGFYGLLAWIWAASRPNRRWLVFVLAWPACLWLAFFVLLALGKARPELWSGTASIGHATLAVIVLGLFAAMDEPKRRPPSNDDEGAERFA